MQFFSVGIAKKSPAERQFQGPKKVKKIRPKRLAILPLAGLSWPAKIRGANPPGREQRDLLKNLAKSVLWRRTESWFHFTGCLEHLESTGTVKGNLIFAKPPYPRVLAAITTFWVPGDVGELRDPRRFSKAIGSEKLLKESSPMWKQRAGVIGRAFRLPALTARIA